MKSYNCWDIGPEWVVEIVELESVVVIISLVVDSTLLLIVESFDVDVSIRSWLGSIWDSWWFVLAFLLVLLLLLFESSQLFWVVVSGEVLLTESEDVGVVESNKSNNWGKK